MVKRKHGNLDDALVCEEGSQTNKSQQRVDDLIDAGAVWDIFRRQDIPKLEKFLWNCSAEFKLADFLLVEQVIYNFAILNVLISTIGDNG